MRCHVTPRVSSTRMENRYVAHVCMIRYACRSGMPCLAHAGTDGQYARCAPPCGTYCYPMTAPALARKYGHPVCNHGHALYRTYIGLVTWYPRRPHTSPVRTVCTVRLDCMYLGFVGVPVCIPDTYGSPPCPRPPVSHGCM